MPPKDTTFTPDRVFLMKDGQAVELSSIGGFTLQRIEPTGEPLPPTPSSDIDFTFTINPDKKAQRFLKRMARKAKRMKPLSIQYKELPLWPRVKLWVIVRMAKLFHKPIAIETTTGKMITAKDINELL